MTGLRTHHRRRSSTNQSKIDEALQESLGKLSPKLRAIIILKEIEESSYEKIADTLEISMGTVKSRIARTREKLQKLMKNLGNKIRIHPFK